METCRPAQLLLTFQPSKPSSHLIHSVTLYSCNIDVKVALKRA